MGTLGESFRQLLMGEVLARNARRFSQKKALLWDGGSLTYGKLNERVDALAQRFLQMGIQKGDKVAVLLLNGREILETCFAAFKAGALAVPINFRLVGKEVEYILNDSEASVFVFGAEFAHTVQSIRADVPRVREFIVVGDCPLPNFKNYEAFIQGASLDEPQVEMEDDEDALILYTAGTTGRPKGALLTHKSFMMNAINWIVEYHTRFEDTLLCIPPIYHVASLGYTLTHFIAGATIHVERDFDPQRTLEITQREKITTLFLVPAMWIRILQVPNLESFDRSSLRIINTGAAIMPVEVKNQLFKVFPNSKIFDCFGQTEMSGGVTVLQSEDALRKPGSVGKPMMGLEVRLVDNEDRDVPVGQVGEAVYRGPTAMRGYHNKPDGTREAMRGGWFHSGDLLRQDEEGYYYVVDRKKDMIISGGENIYPAEVEEVLYAHPAILEAAVIGVPDEKWGESVKAIIVVKPGKELSAEDVSAHCKANLASYKKPKSVDFVPALPRSAAGKVLKTVLREKYWIGRERKI